MAKALVRPNAAEIVRLRAAGDLTQEDLALRAGYAKRTIERIEAGHLTKPATLSDVAAVLKVSMDTLLLHSDEPSSASASSFVSQWIDATLESVSHRPSPDVFHIADLICPPDADGVTLTCITSLGPFTYTLRRNVTVMELCAAIREDLFNNTEGYNSLTLGKTVSEFYDPRWTVAAVSKHSGGTVYFIRLTSGILGVATSAPIDPGSLWPLAAAGRSSLYASLNSIYVWLFDRPIFSGRRASLLLGKILGTVCRFVIADLNLLAWAYAEWNCDLDFAYAMARVLRKVPDKLLGDDYFDTMAWLLYRQGRYAEAWSMLTKLLPVRSWSSSGDYDMYHAYFILRGLGEASLAADIKECFELDTWLHKFPRARVVNDDDAWADESDRTYSRQRLPTTLKFGIFLAIVALVVAFIRWR